MRTPAIILLGIVVMATGCSLKREALHYFKKITSYDTKVGKLRTLYEKRIEDAISNRILGRDFGKPEALRQEFVKEFGVIISELYRINSFHGYNDFINAAIRYFSAIRDYFNKEKKEIIRLRSRVLPPTEEENNTIAKLQGQIDAVNRTILEDFMNAQNQFAVKYGFPLIQNETNR